MSERPPTLSRLETLPARAVLEGLAKLHQAVFASDAHGRLVWISDALGTLRGTVARSDPAKDDQSWRMARPAREYFAHPEQLEEIRRRFARDGQVHGARAELLGCDGQLIPVEIDAVHVAAASGEEPVLVGIVRPRAELERRDQELRETAAFLSGILESSPAPVLAVDGRGFITYANPAIRDLLGHAPEELLEKPVAMLASSPGELANAILGSEAISNQEIELQHADGSSRFASLSASELKLVGRSAGSVVLIHDHTDQRRRHEELQRKNGELEHYVQNVTHDLRSPLVSLLGFSRLLSQEYGDGMDETARHFLDRIEKAGHAMEALINDLLELSRIGQTRDYKAYVNVNDVLAQLQAELKPRLESQQIRLSLPVEPVVVLCDRTRLYQVFANLIGNALDYMGPTPDAEISIEVHEEPGEHRVVVRDNGRGVDPAHRERIFELFQSSGPRADGRRGTGIGLAIVKKIAQSQGGRVWVEGRPGEGAAFHVTLPRD